MVNLVVEKLKNSGKTVFTFQDMYAVLGVGLESRKDKTVKLLSQILLRELVKEKLLFRPRKNIYTLSQHQYSAEELGCILYSKSYVSLETVLAKHGIIKSKRDNITFAAYVSRKIKIGSKTLIFKELKPEILNNMEGVLSGTYKEATKERAFLDLLYLEPEYNKFKNLESVDHEKIKAMLHMYKNKKFKQRVQKFLKIGE